MQVQINTNRIIEIHDALGAQVSGIAESALSRIRDHITRVEVHLNDTNSHKSNQNDNGAADRVARLIESAFRRLRDQKSHKTDPSPPGPKPPEE